MNNCCANSVVRYTQGNDVLFRVKYFQGESEFTLDGYDNWRVTLLRDGVVKTDTECLLDADNRVIIHCPASLPVGRYAVETTMSSLGMKRRSFLCGEIEIVECDEDANVGSGVIVSGDMAEISVTFELVSIVWTQGKNAYEFWKIDHPDGTLQEYIDLISISQQDVQNLENDVTRIQGDIRSLMYSVQTLSTEKQETLVSGENIKTINGQSILGSGNIDIQGGGGGAQVQSDWNETNVDAPSYIKNKPNVYVKPTTGIPSTDLAQAVQTSLGKAETALQVQEQADWNETDNTKPSFIKNKPTIPDVSNFVEKNQTSGLLRNDGTVDTNHYLVNAPVTSVNGQTGAVSLNIPSAQVNSDWNASSGVAAILNKPTIPDVSNLAEKVVVVDASTMPSTLQPNKVYQMGTLTGSVTIPPFANVPSGDTEAKIWFFTFETGTTAPTITWSAAITNWVGGSAPTINASKKYELSVMDGIGAILEA